MPQDTRCRILDDFHRPTEFPENVEVWQRRHVTMRLGMDCDILEKLFECPGEQRWAVLDTGADREVSRTGLSF